ncbi:hypothetical protein HK101_004291, partial [Irineochytrium annulatum]
TDLGSKEALNKPTGGEVAERQQTVRSPVGKQAVCLLDAKRQNNCCIMLSRIKLPFSEIREDVLSAAEALPENLVKQFMAFVPTEQEIATIRDYVNDRSDGSTAEERMKELGKAELFFLELAKVSRLKQRLDSMYFKIKFAERIEDLQPNVHALLNASRVVKESKNLAKVMELILAVGNYMNGDSFRGGAYGFSIDTLLKLGETKSANGKTTFLHYLVGLIDKKLPECKNLLNELSGLEKASKISLAQTTQDINDLVKGFRDLELEIAWHQEHKSSASPNDKFVQVFAAFRAQHQDAIGELQKRRADAESAFKAAAAYFGEDATTSTPENLFGMFHKFASDLERARKENEREAENQRKAAERAEKLAKNPTTVSHRLSADPSSLASGIDLTRKTMRQTPDASGSQDILNSERKGVMDELISSIRTGEIHRANKLKHRGAGNGASSSVFGSSKTAMSEDGIADQ